MANFPILPPSSYVTPVAVGFSDTQGGLSIVGSEAPLPVSTVRRSATPPPLTGSTSAATIAGPFLPLVDAPIHLQLSGTWAGTVAVERSVDGGASRQPLTVGGSAWARFTGNANEVVWQEGESGASFYLSIALTSGTLAYRVSQ